jgi:hypothetical protein
MSVVMAVVLPLNKASERPYTTITRPMGLVSLRIPVEHLGEILQNALVLQTAMGMM